MSDTQASISAVRRARTTPDSARIVVTGERDQAIVRFLLRFGAATSGQVRHAFDLSVNGGNRVLRRLFDAGLVRRHVPTLIETGTWHTQPVYTIGPQAAPWVAEWEDLPLDEARKRCRGDRTPTYLAHALSIVELYLSLQAALSAQHEWALRSFLVERECLDTLAIESGESEQRITLRPDAVAILRQSASGAQWAFALESDRHNVRARAFSHKTAGYRLYVQSGAWREAYPGVAGLTICVVTGSASRIETLADVVRASRAHGLFLFATRSDIERAGFFGPVWRGPDDTTFNSLLVNTSVTGGAV